MQGIFYAAAVIGVLTHSVFGVLRNETGKEVVEALQRNATSGNESIVIVHNDTTTDDLSLDITHPIIAAEVLYENYRRKMHDWMEDSSTYLVMMSAMAGALSAFVTFLLCAFYVYLCRCRSRRRQHKTVDIVNRLNDNKNPFEVNDDSDNDLI
ncbi:hypothetical protein Tcan_15353 [Toxocara canis]|uniref:Uncharacterized protein n=1 Tax=Toxocara canis TaxID=6265 RepID=A0A0B2VBW9_TOXCA|nr:hypothetical protein Tcan_15353 [Toxocara canis]